MTDLIAATLLSLLACVLTYAASIDLWKRRVSSAIIERASTFAFLASVVASSFGIAYKNWLDTVDFPSAIIAHTNDYATVLQEWYMPLLVLSPVSLLLLMLAIRRNYVHAPRLSVLALLVQALFLASLLLI